MTKYKKNRTLKDKLKFELIFWVHFLFIVAVIFVGLFVPLQIIVAAFIVWQLHLMILNNRCILTVAQDRIDGEAGDHQPPFIATLIFRFTGKVISEKTHANILTGLFLLFLSVALLADILDFRINLF